MNNLINLLLKTTLSKTSIFIITNTVPNKIKKDLNISGTGKCVLAIKKPSNKQAYPKQKNVFAYFLKTSSILISNYHKT